MRSIRLAKTALAVGVTASLLLGADRQNSSVLAASLPNDDKAIVHVLNRIGFGPRPGDVEKVRAMGLQAYIDQQLHPVRGNHGHSGANQDYVIETVAALEKIGYRETGLHLLAERLK